MHVDLFLQIVNLQIKIVCDTPVWHSCKHLWTENEGKKIGVGIWTNQITSATNEETFPDIKWYCYCILLLYINYRSIPYFSPFALFCETNVWYTYILNSYIFRFHIHLFQIKNIFVTNLITLKITVVNEKVQFLYDSLI